MAGPEEDEVVVPIAEEDWESDVEAMEHSLERGWHPRRYSSHTTTESTSSKTATTASRHSAARERPMRGRSCSFSSEEDRDRYVQEHGGGIAERTSMPPS